MSLLFHALPGPRIAAPILVGLACVALANVAVATPYQWRNVEIQGGGLVSGVVFHPTQPGLLYARTDVGGAYRWLPENGSWLPLNDELGHADTETLGVLSLAVDPNDPHWLGLACGQYVAPWAEPAVFLDSSDRGAPGSWRRSTFPFVLAGNDDGRTAGERLAVDLRDSTMLLLGTSADGLWRSADRGRTWRRVESFAPKHVTFVHSGATAIHVGTTDGDSPILRSLDEGRTWSAMPGQPTGLIPHHADFDRLGTLYVTYADALGPNGMTDGAVWKLDSTSGAWRDITPVRPGADPQDKFGYAGLALDAQRPGTLLVTTNNRWHRGDDVYRSTDGGATWRPLWGRASTDANGAPWVYWGRAPQEFRPHWMGDIDIDPFNSDRAIFITGAGVWVCENLTAADRDASTLWRFLNRGLEETVVTALVCPPEGAPLISTLGDIDGFRHDDLDRSPLSGQHHPTRGSAFSLDVAALAPSILVRSHADGPVRASISLDGARTWSLLPSEPTGATPTGPGAVAISADGRTIHWLPGDGPPSFSSDRGVTWTAGEGGPGTVRDYRINRPVTDRVDPDLAYILDLVRGEFWVTRDGGRKYTIVRRSLGEKNLAPPVAVPGLAGHVWVPLIDGLLRSVDGARHFEAIASVEAAYAFGFGRAAPGTEHPAIFLAGRVDGVDGLFRSDDIGVSWLRINNESQQFGRILCLTGDPRTFGRVYLGTGGRGIIVGDPH